MMPTRFMRAALVCATMLALTGCIFSNKPVFDINKGATDVLPGRFEMKSGEDKMTVELTRHGNLYTIGVGLDRMILSFHGIGDGFYLVTAIQSGAPIKYTLLDARSHDKYRSTGFLDCHDTTPADRVPSPEAKGKERCKATDPDRLTAIANRYKADMMADRIETSDLVQLTRIP